MWVITSVLKISNVLFIPCSASVMIIQDKKQFHVPIPHEDYFLSGAF